MKDIANGKVGFFSEDNINIFYKDGTYDALKKNVPSAVLFFAAAGGLSIITGIHL